MSGRDTAFGATRVEQCCLPYQSILSFSMSQFASGGAQNEQVLVALLLVVLPSCFILWVVSNFSLRWPPGGCAWGTQVLNSAAAASLSLFLQLDGRAHVRTSVLSASREQSRGWPHTVLVCEHGSCCGLPCCPGTCTHPDSAASQLPPRPRLPASPLAQPVFYPRVARRGAPAVGSLGCRRHLCRPAPTHPRSLFRTDALSHAPRLQGPSSAAAGGPRARRIVAIWSRGCAGGRRVRRRRRRGESRRSYKRWVARPGPAPRRRALRAWRPTAADVSDVTLRTCHSSSTSSTISTNSSSSMRQITVPAADHLPSAGTARASTEPRSAQYCRRAISAARDTGIVHSLRRCLAHAHPLGPPRRAA
eukprot:250757-Chlamydomonas_euryale.AAC.14